MKIGINISHDSGIALTDDSGKIFYAVGEERFSRIKNHTGIPAASLGFLENYLKDQDISECIIGGNQNITLEGANQFVLGLEGNPSNPNGKWNSKVAPGQNTLNKYGSKSPKEIIENKLIKTFPQIFSDSVFTWDRHHDSHLGCAIGVSQGEGRLLVSLDNAGDGESGAIGTYSNGSFESLKRIHQIDSLGALYSAVTERYNFKPGSHEGKITGLAALGAHSEAVEILSRYIEIKNGNLKIKHSYKLKDIVIGKVFSKFGRNIKSKKQLSEIIDMAESKTTNYADLAFAVQHVLEGSVLELIKYWVDKTQIKDVALAGGVFANVKLNQKISEAEFIRDVQIFPNMGDGGIAIGGIWSQLAKRGQLSQEKLFEDMYLAPSTELGDSHELRLAISDPALKVEKLSSDFVAKRIASDIDKGLIIAHHSGKMEFGPRALGNRSIILDPRRGDMILKINKRLRRTEFMPLAPIVMEEEFDRYFEKSATQSMAPFKYMTMTCNVKLEWRSKLPAITHLDGTARPQVLARSTNNKMYEILDEFSKLTGFHLLVNTSLNIHEEPINFTLEDSINALKDNAFDILVFEEYLIYGKNLQIHNT